MTPGCWNFHSTRPPCGKTMCPCRASTPRAVRLYQTWGGYFFSIPYQVILLQAFWAHVILQWVCKAYMLIIPFYRCGN